jgi:RimJ/RimL family protein N-acetyltransferase
LRIETERLVLDLHSRDDFSAMADMWADPDTVRFIGGRVGTRQDAWMRLLRYRGLWPLLGYGYWAVREKASGRFAGELGFADFGRDMTPDISGIPEAGWVMASWARGRGFASEALMAALAWLDTTEQKRSVCIIDPENGPSLRLAGKLGYGDPVAGDLNGPVTVFTRVGGRAH